VDVCKLAVYSRPLSSKKRMIYACSGKKQSTPDNS